jgi:flagellar basal body-associated protein FliL
LGDYLCDLFWNPGETDMKSGEQGEQENGGSWIIILAMAILFIAWGIFAYFVIGEKGPHPWDFGTVEDIPGESAYSTYQPDRISGSYPSERQHVSGKTPGAKMIKGESAR